MWRGWFHTWFSPKAARFQEASLETVVVPHARWTEWLQAHKWEHAAACLDDLQRRSDRTEIHAFLPDWKESLVVRFLEAGWDSLDPESALSWIRQVDRLADLNLKNDRLEAFRHVADLLWDAHRAAAQGDFQLTIQRLESATKLLDAETHKHCAGRIQHSIKTAHHLHEPIVELNVLMRISSDESDWIRASALARQILTMAPEHPGAHAVLKRPASDVRVILPDPPVGATVPYQPAGQSVHPDQDRSNPPAEQSAPSKSGGHSPQPMQQLPEFFIVSIDRGDSWLITLRESFEVGPPSQLRLNHLFGLVPDQFRVQLARDEEGCWMGNSPSDSVKINGKSARQFALVHGMRIQVGDGPEFLFHQPRMETGSARLERIAGPTGQGIRGLLLVGLVLNIGADDHSEVIHPEFRRPLLLLRRHGSVHVKRDTEWLVNGRKAVGEVPLQIPCQMRVEQTGVFWES